MVDDLTVEAVFDDGRAPRRQRTVRLSWSATDPLAVLVDVAGMSGGPWVVARDVLRSGLSQATGIGTVRVGPVGQEVALTLRADQSPVVVRLRATRLRTFLDRTDTIIRPGAELCDESLDAALDDMLDDQ